MGSFLTQVQPTSDNSTLYNYRGTGFVKLHNVASGSAEDTYILTVSDGKATFNVTSSKLANIADSAGAAFVIDTNLVIQMSDDTLFSTDTAKAIKIGSFTKSLVSTFKSPGDTPAARNPIILKGAEYLVVYDGTNFVVMNEAMMIDRTTYTSLSSTTDIENMAAPTIELMQHYVGQQLKTRYTYVVCPAAAANIPSGAVYKDGTTEITGTMAASSDCMYIIYLVKHNVHTPSANDVYDEWICIATSGSTYAWEKIGNTDVNISHTHNINSSGAHSHTMVSDGSHSHEVTVASHSHTIPSGGSHSHSVSLTLNPQFATSPNGTTWTDTETPNVVKVELGNSSSNTGEAGSHSHTVSTQSSHSHSVTVNVSTKLSSSPDGTTYGEESDVLELKTYSPNANTGNAGSHSHTVNEAGGHSHTEVSAGSHSHTIVSDGSHSHSFSYSASVSGETLVLTGSSNTGYAGSHSHTVNEAGDHSHTINSAGSHSHTVNEGGYHSHSVTKSASTVYIKVTTTASGSSGLAGSHSHTTGDAPDHSHSIPSFTSSEYIKLTMSGSGSASNSGAHTHTTDADSSHTLTTTQNGSHSHTVNSGGSHSHTTGQPV